MIVSEELYCTNRSVVYTLFRCWPKQRGQYNGQARQHKPLEKTFYASVGMLSVQL